MFSNTYVACLFVATMFYVTSNYYAYKLPEPYPTGPVIRNSEYRGSVFIIKETSYPDQPFVPLIADGGIEVVKGILPSQQQTPFLPSRGSLHQQQEQQQPTVDIPEDQEYFAVLVTPETIAQSQISRTTTVTVPLNMLLYGASARIPWLLVLKKDSHYEYFKMLQEAQRRNSQRRRGKELAKGYARLSSNEINCEILNVQEEVLNVQKEKSTTRERFILNTASQNSPNSSSEMFDFEMEPSVGTRSSTGTDSIINRVPHSDSATSANHSVNTSF